VDRKQDYIEPAAHLGSRNIGMVWITTSASPVFACVDRSYPDDA
jgi:hypothetical protein